MITVSPSKPSWSATLISMSVRACPRARLRPTLVPTVPEYKERRRAWTTGDLGPSSGRASRADHRVGALTDRKRRRPDAVCRQPRLDRVDDLDDRARLPFRANANLVTRAIERDRGPVE